MKLYQPYSRVSIFYKSISNYQDRVIVDQGVLVTPLDPQLEGRVFVEASELIMKKLTTADTGVFRVIDLAGFPVAHYHITVESKKKQLIK